MKGGNRHGAGRPAIRLLTDQVRREDIRSLARFQYMRPEDTSTWVGSLQVGVEWQPCRFGGFRPWFLCPDCRRRCGHLYLLRELPKCRRCGQLAYPSQSQDAFDRSWRRTRKLEARIGCEDFMTKVPIKPKHMRWQTFSECVRSLRREQALRNAIFVGWGKRLDGLE